MSGEPDRPDGGKGKAASGGTWIVAAAFVLALAVTGFLFAWPSLTGGQISDEVASDREAEAEAALAELGEDPLTRTYFRKLDSAFPAEARQLRETLLVALERGVPEGEIGVLLLQAGSEPIMQSLQRLSKADIRYANEVMELTRSRLEGLSASGAPYCMGTDLVAYAELAEQEAYLLLQSYLAPGEPLYDYSLETLTILLDAVIDARIRPQNRGYPSRADMSALQTLGTGALFDSDLTLLLTTEGKSRREMDAALETVNFCDLGVRMIQRVENLPEMTKARLWTTGLDYLDRYGIRRIIWMMSAY